MRWIKIANTCFMVYSAAYKVNLVPRRASHPKDRDPEFSFKTKLASVQSCVSSKSNALKNASRPLAISHDFRYANGDFAKNVTASNNNEITVDTMTCEIDQAFGNPDCWMSLQSLKLAVCTLTITMKML